MSVGDTRRQGWQCAHMLAIYGQLILIVGVHQLSPPSAPQRIGNPSATNGVDGCVPICLPLAQGFAQRRELSLQQHVVIPQVFTSLAHGCQVGVQLQFTEGREDLVQAPPDRLLAALAAAAEGITQATIGKTPGRANTTAYRRKPQQPAGLITISHGGLEQPIAKLSEF
ncbi:hypothetical protein D3C79_828280 [compost metagenome]